MAPKRVHPDPRVRDRFFTRVSRILDVWGRHFSASSGSLARAEVKALLSANNYGLLSLKSIDLANRIAAARAKGHSMENPAKFAQAIANVSILEGHQPINVAELQKAARQKGIVTALRIRMGRYTTGEPGTIIGTRSGKRQMVVPPRGFTRIQAARTVGKCAKSVRIIGKYNGNLIYPPIKVPRVQDVLSLLYKSIYQTGDGNLMQLSALELANRVVVLMRRHNADYLSRISPTAITELPNAEIFAGNEILTKGKITSMIAAAKPRPPDLATSTIEERREGRTLYSRALSYYKTLVSRRSRRDFRASQRLALGKKWTALRPVVEEIFAIDYLLEKFPAILLVDPQIVVETCRHWYAISQFVGGGVPTNSTLKDFVHEVFWKARAKQPQ